jgi:hypothetical protein
MTQVMHIKKLTPLTITNKAEKVYTPWAKKIKQANPGFYVQM